MFSCEDFLTGTFDVTISEAEGVYKTPYTLSSLDDVTLATNEIIDASGNKVYFAVYTYTAIGEDSVLYISSTATGVEFTIVAGVDEDNVVTKNSDGNLSFTFLVSSTSPMTDIPVSITLTPVQITE